MNEQSIPRAAPCRQGASARFLRKDVKSRRVAGAPCYNLVMKDLSFRSPEAFVESRFFQAFVQGLVEWLRLLRRRHFLRAGLRHVFRPADLSRAPGVQGHLRRTADAGHSRCDLPGDSRNRLGGRSHGPDLCALGLRAGLRRAWATAAGRPAYVFAASHLFTLRSRRRGRRGCPRRTR